MKRKSLLVAAILMASIATNAQSASKNTKDPAQTEKRVTRLLEGKDVSPQSVSQFSVDFGKTSNAKWTRNKNFDEVTFIKNNNHSTAFYDANSKLVGTTSISSFAKLPAKAQKEIDEKYKGYKKNGVIFYDDNEKNDTDMVLYSTPFDDSDSYFVELAKNNNKIVLQVDPKGKVALFAKE
ncbi:hypothetical protein [Flavobacterium sp.]|uniref:hypothetical protein n=1 Tax=Flavobacterium sp. TaxID=239 RepID=UPI003D0D4A85